MSDLFLTDSTPHVSYTCPRRGHDVPKIGISQDTKYVVSKIKMGM